MPTRWEKLSNIGIKPSMEHGLQKQIMLCNRLCMLLIGLMLLVLPIQALLINTPFKAMALAGLLPIVLLCLLLNNLGAHLWGRLLLAISLPGFIYTFSIFVRYYNVLELNVISFIEPVFFIMGMVGLPVMLFSMRANKEIVYGIYLFYAALILSFTPVNTALGVFVNNETAKGAANNYLSPLLSLLAIVGSFLFMKQTNQLFEERILRSREELMSAEEELRQNLEELQTVQERVVAQERQLNTVFDGIPNAIFVTAPADGTIIMANQKALDTFERVGESLVGSKTGARYVDPGARDEMIERMRKYGRVNGFETQVLDRDGRPLWISMHVSPVDFNGRPFLLTVALEIGDLKRWKEAVLEKNKALTEKNEELQTMEEELRQNVEELQTQRDFVEEANKKVEARNRLIEKLSTSLMTISKHETVQQGHWEQALEFICTAVSQSLGIHRVSIWKYDAANQTLTCEKQFDQNVLGYTEGGILEASQYPSYFKAIQHEGITAAHNAHTHPHTFEFSEGYLLPLQIYSMIDAPIFVDGKLYGIVCCEYLYEERKWQLEEETFIKSITDLLTVAYQSAQQVQQQKELSQKNVALQQAQEILNIQKTALDREHKNTVNSIEYALTIQQSLLPSVRRKDSIFPNSFVLYRPKDIVSGDFYWMSAHSNELRLLGALDCTGHGVPGAFMSIIGHNLLTDLIHQKHIREPHQLLEALHQGVVAALSQSEGGNDDGMDAGICAIRKEGNDYRIAFSGAKNSFFYTKNGVLEEIRGTRRTVGGAQSKTAKPFELHEIVVPAGEMIYLATDGFQDQNDARRHRFSSTRLRQLMQNFASFPITEQSEAFNNELNRFMEAEAQRDDITLVGVRL